jgi:putative DNA primase/helicase
MRKSTRMKNQNQNISNENNGKNENRDQSIIFEPVAPHPEPVAIGELLTEIEAVIKRHVVLSDAAATALAVWVLHTYVYESRDTVAYVAIESPEKRCSKTTLLTVLAAMANKPLITANVTVGALFCAIDTCRPTLFIDEADTFLAGNGTMRGIINSGNTWRTAYVLRMSRAKRPPSPQITAPEPKNPESPDSFPIPHSEIRNQEGVLKRYSCWCPKVIAMIGNVPDTIADRSIVVHMTRKLPAEMCAPLAELDPAAIKAKCARFARDARQLIAKFEKIRVEGLNDRAADTFDPLYVIARLAGKEWEEKLHAAALAISPEAASKNAAAELLLDIFTIFISTGRQKIFTRQLVEMLKNEKEFTITSTALKDPSIDEYKISEFLRAYGIKPSPCRIGSRVARGYKPEDFIEALKRYVPKADLDARSRAVEQHLKLLDEAEKFAEDMEHFSRANGKGNDEDEDDES